MTDRIVQGRETQPEERPEEPVLPPVVSLPRIRAGVNELLVPFSRTASNFVSLCLPRVSSEPVADAEPDENAFQAIDPLRSLIDKMKQSFGEFFEFLGDMLDSVTELFMNEEEVREREAARLRRQREEVSEQTPLPTVSPITVALNDPGPRWFKGLFGSPRSRDSEQGDDHASLYDVTRGAPSRQEHEQQVVESTTKISAQFLDAEDISRLRHAVTTNNVHSPLLAAVERVLRERDNNTPS